MEPPPIPESSFPSPGLEGFFDVVVLVVVVVVVVVVVEVVVGFLVVVLIFVSGEVVLDFSAPKNTFQRGTWSLLSSCTPHG